MQQSAQKRLERKAEVPMYHAKLDYLCQKGYFSSPSWMKLWEITYAIPVSTLVFCKLSGNLSTLLLARKTFGPSLQQFGE